MNRRMNPNSAASPMYPAMANDGAQRVEPLLLNATSRLTGATK